MERLPLDLVMNILCRLSVKHLLRFRCVSKPFCSLIDSQEFIKIHLKCSIETDSNLSLILSGSPGLIVASSGYWAGKIFSASLDSLHIAVELDHPFKDCKGPANIIDSCNGLIALKNYWSGIALSNQSINGIALWNPSTKKHLILPKFWIDIKHCDFLVDGFGYDDASDDYKVVRIIQFGGKRLKDTELAIYSLKTNSWRRIRVDFPYYFLQPFDGTFANGHVHWLVAKNPRECLEEVIVAFDLKVEEFHEVPLPPLKNRNLVDLMFLSTFRGCLHFSCLSCHPEVDIWVMKESWTKPLSFSRTIFGYCDYVKALAYSEDGNKVLVDKFEYQDDEDADANKWKLDWCDLQNQSAAGQVTILGVPRGCRHTILCVNSLVSLAAYKGRGV